MKPTTNRILPVAASPDNAAPRTAGALPPTAQTPATESAPRSRAGRSSRGTVDSRLRQLFDIKKVPQQPAVSIDRWDEQAILDICERWRESQLMRPSIVGLARLVALNFERARPDQIAEDKKGLRLLPEGAAQEAYYEEMAVTFLRTVGLEDTDQVLDSFKKAGTGGLHRQRVAMASAVGGAFTVAQLAASAHLPAKAALSGVQLLLTALTTKASLDSGSLRFRNSGTEEIMPLGKADASPSAKTGPNVMRASVPLIFDFPKIVKSVRKMEDALEALEDAKARLANPDASPQARLAAERDVKQAGEALSIAFARFCMRNEMKSDYKAASESAKIEYYGNKRLIGMGVGTSALTISATVLGILTPIAVSAAVTGGVTAAATVAGALAYVGYQLSTGPSKDGEDKAKRAIVALAKSLDLLAGNAAAQQKARAGAYRTYIAEKRATKSLVVRKGAKEKLIATLEDIARRDSTKDDLDPLKNWTDYTAHREQVSAAQGNEAAIQAHEEAFEQAHASKFNAATVADAWKTPERMRFDSMRRLLLGTVSESLASLQRFAAESGRNGPEKSGSRAGNPAQRHGALHANIKASLRDWINFELGQSQLKAALAEPDAAVATPTMHAAACSLAAIANADARALFSTDGRKQVEATALAKRMTIGERERYTVTNAGAATFAGLVNLTASAASLGLNIEHGVHTEHSHGAHAQPTFANQNDSRPVAQGSGPVTAPYSAAERARFQKTSMTKLVDTIARKGEPVVAKLDLPRANSMVLDAGDPRTDAAIDAWLADLEAARDIPDQIALSVDGKKIASGKLSDTTAYYAWRYKNAPLGTKMKFLSRQAVMLAEGLGTAVVPPIAQGIARIPLARTRAAVDRGKSMSLTVRDQLTSLAGDARADAPAAPPKAMSEAMSGPTLPERQEPMVELDRQGAMIAAAGGVETRDQAHDDDAADRSDAGSVSTVDAQWQSDGTSDAASVEEAPEAPPTNGREVASAGRLEAWLASFPVEPPTAATSNWAASLEKRAGLGGTVESPQRRVEAWLANLPAGRPTAATWAKSSANARTTVPATQGANDVLAGHSDPEKTSKKR